MYYTQISRFVKGREEAVRVSAPWDCGKMGVKEVGNLQKT